jgi:hypothetical protein
MGFLKKFCTIYPPFLSFISTHLRFINGFLMNYGALLMERQRFNQEEYNLAD